MIHHQTGNLLDCEAEALVNTVNTIGVMGKGIALQFKNMFPNNFKLYAKACFRNEQINYRTIFSKGELCLVFHHK